MGGFFQRLQGRMAAWMQGRYGVDEFSNALVIAGIVCMVLSLFGLDAFSWVALALLAYATFRTCSRNMGKRLNENATYIRLIAKPKSWVKMAGLSWKNRATTKYFMCKGCGQVLSVPKGKGTLRIVCPKCKTEVTKRS